MKGTGDRGSSRLNSTLFAVIHANGLWEQGRLIRTRLFIHDVTAQKEMESALKKVHNASGVQVRLELPDNLKRMPRDLEIAISRIAQECLANIHRHSESPVASIRLSENSGGIVLEIADQGKGMDRRQLNQFASSRLPGIGLRGIRERIQNLQGAFELLSDARGTRLRVVIPTEEKQSPGSSHMKAI